MNKFNIGDEVQLRGKKGEIIEIVYNDNECGKYIEYKFLDELGYLNYGTEDDLQPIDTQEDKTTLTTNANDGEYMQYQTERDLGISGLTNIPYTQTIMVDYEKKYNQSKEENATLKRIIQLQKQKREITNELVELYSKVDM